MNNIEFDEQNFPRNNAMYSSSQNQKTGSKMGDWLVRNGLAKDANMANIILLFFGIFIFALSFYFFVFGFELPFQQQEISNPAPFPPDIEL